MVRTYVLKYVDFPGLWGGMSGGLNFLGNKPMVDALLSRVRHYCHTVTIQGPSLRDPQG